MNGKIEKMHYNTTAEPNLHGQKTEIENPSKRINCAYLTMKHPSHTSLLRTQVLRRLSTLHRCYYQIHQMQETLSFCQNSNEPTEDSSLQ